VPILYYHAFLFQGMTGLSPSVMKRQVEISKIVNLLYLSNNLDPPREAIVSIPSKENHEYRKIQF